VEVMNIFADEEILEGIKPRMEQLAGNAARFEALPHAGEFRQCGMVAAVEMVQEKKEKTPYPWEERRGLEVFKWALGEGVLLRPLGNVVYFMPPLTISGDEMQRLIDTAWEGIRRITGD